MSSLFVGCTSSVFTPTASPNPWQMITLHYLPWRITVHGVLTMYTIRLAVR